MLRLTTAIPIACYALLLCAPATEAQSAHATNQRELSISAGLAFSDRVDEVVSPSRFAGAGLDAGIGYASLGGKAAILVSLRGGTRALSASGAQRSGEQLTDGELHVSVFPVRGTSALGTRVMLGIDLQASAAVISHHYMDPEERTMSYVFGTMTLGPAIMLEHSLGAGTATVQLAVPVVGVVAQPYSAVWSSRPPLDLHVATLGSLRSAAAAVAYRSPARYGVALLSEYRLSVMRYEHVLPVRGLSHSVAIGVARPL
jgi:hypothetical protein